MCVMYSRVLYELIESYFKYHRIRHNKEVEESTSHTLILNTTAFAMIQKSEQPTSPALNTTAFAVVQKSEDTTVFAVIRKSGWSPQNVRKGCSRSVARYSTTCVTMTSGRTLKSAQARSFKLRIQSNTSPRF